MLEIKRIVPTTLVVLMQEPQSALPQLQLQTLLKDASAKVDAAATSLEEKVAALPSVQGSAWAREAAAHAVDTLPADPELVAAMKQTFALQQQSATERAQLPAAALEESVASAARADAPRADECVVYGFETSFCPLDFVYVAGACVPVRFDGAFSRCEEAVRELPLRDLDVALLTVKCRLRWPCALSLREKEQLQSRGPQALRAQLCVPRGRECPLHFVFDEPGARCLALGAFAAFELPRNGLEPCAARAAPVPSAKVAEPCPIDFEQRAVGPQRFECVRGRQRITWRNAHAVTHEMFNIVEQLFGVRYRKREPKPLRVAATKR